MAKQAKPGDVDAFMASLEHPLKAELEALRTIIRGVDAAIGESIKWNAPSFYLQDHFATFNLRQPAALQLVLHTGAKVKPDAQPMAIDDPAGLLKWADKNRCIATFASMRDVEANREAFVTIIRQWIAQL